MVPSISMNYSNTKSALKVSIAISRVVQNEKIPSPNFRFFQFFTKVIDPIDVQIILYLSINVNVYRHDFDKLFKYEIDFESSDLRLKFEQLLQNFKRRTPSQIHNAESDQCNAGE